MSTELVTKFSPYVDEQFKAESKRSLLTNTDYDWTGAHSVKVYKVTTAGMNDYDREGSTLTDGKWSRYGVVEGLDATTEELTLRKDRSFTFAIDKLDADETANVLNAAAALARSETLFPLLYLGVMATAVALLFQNMGEALSDPSSAAVILSLESVFGVISSVIFYGDPVTAQLLAGFALIFVAVVCSETKFSFLRKK